MVLLKLSKKKILEDKGYFYVPKGGGADIR